MELGLLQLSNYLAVLSQFSKGLNRGSSEDLSFVKFKRNEFSYLNITNIGSNAVEDSIECGFACLEIPSCFSYNLAVSTNRDVNGKMLCELLPSDKYNNSDKFMANPLFHHFSIPCLVDGGLTEWSQWGRCDKLCENGKQRRHKTCTNPKPSCGGKHCDASLATEEDRPCFYCPGSGIRSYRDFCVAPNNKGCSPPDGTYLIFTKKRGSACNNKDMIFFLDTNGVIHHKCSKKVICPQDNNPTYSKKLMLKGSCDSSISRHLRLKSYSALKNLKNNFCVHPYNGWPREGLKLVYWVGCGKKQLKLDFFQLVPPTGS